MADNLQAQEIQALKTRLLQLEEANRELRASKEITQNYLDIAGVMLLALDTRQRVTMINPKGCQVLGYSQDEIIGQNWFDKFLPKENIDEINQVFTQIVSGNIKPVQYYEAPILRKDGEKRVIAWQNSILYDQNGDIIGIFSSGEDITEFKQLDANLRLTQFAVDRAIDACFWIVEQGNFFYVNETALQMLGYAREEFLSMSVQDIDPNFPQEVWSRHWKELREKGQMVLETHHRTKDGQLIPIEAAVNYLEFEGTAYNIAFCRDITQRKETQLELDRHRDHLEEMVRERTEKLQKLINLMAGREVRMAELKKVIKALRAQLKDAGLKPVADDPLLGEQD
jgi:PAS domain S-box-containing protein